MRCESAARQSVTKLTASRFEKKVNPRKFKGYITEAQSHTGGQDEP